MTARIYQFRRDRFEIPAGALQAAAEAPDIELFNPAEYSRETLLAVQLAYASADAAGEPPEFGEGLAADWLRGIQPNLTEGAARALARDIRAWAAAATSSDFRESITPEERVEGDIRFRLYEDGFDFTTLPSESQ